MKPKTAPKSKQNNFLKILFEGTILLKNYIRRQRKQGSLIVYSYLLTSEKPQLLQIKCFFMMQSLF